MWYSVVSTKLLYLVIPTFGTFRLSGFVVSTLTHFYQSLPPTPLEIPCLDRWRLAICFQLSQCQVVDILFLTRVWTHRLSGGRGKRYHRTRITRSRFKSWSTHLWAVYHCCTVMPLFTTCGRTMATVLVCPFTHLTRVYYTTIACNYSPGP